MRLYQLSAPLSFALLLMGTACSSGSSDPLVEESVVQNDDPIETLDEAPSSEPSVDINQNDPIQEPDPTPDPIPSAPVENLEELGVPVIEGDSNEPVRAFADLLEQVVVFGLTDLNEKLQSGEQLSEAENDCLGSFDPAIGEALLSIECTTGSVPLVNGVFSLVLFEAGVAQTAACNEGLLALDGSDCRLTNADLLIPVEWTMPDAGLPTPFPSGEVEFNLSPGSLDITSLPNSLTGNFDCSFDFETGAVDTGALNSNCTNALDNVAERLQVWLDRRESF